MIKIDIEDIIAGRNSEVNDNFVLPWKRSIQNAFDLFIHQYKQYKIENKLIGLSKNGKQVLSTLDIDSCLLKIPKCISDIYDKENYKLSNDDLLIIHRIFDYELFKKSQCPNWGLDNNGIIKRNIVNIHFGRDQFCKILSTKKLKICPYCNFQSIQLKSTISRLRFDHYYKKSEYPFLGICLSNLVPSCTVCNEDIKAQEEMSLNKYCHPYYDDLDDNIMFFIVPTSDSNQFEIKIKKRRPDPNIRAINSCNLLKIIDRCNEKDNIVHDHIKALYHFLQSISSKELHDIKIKLSTIVADFDSQILRQFGYCKKTEINNIMYGKISRDLILKQYDENDIL